jgi:hypothetical protein
MTAEPVEAPRFDKDALIASICGVLLNRPFNGKRDADVARNVRRLLTMRISAHGRKVATNAKALAAAARQLHILLNETFGTTADDTFKEHIEWLDRLERCTGPDVRTNFEKRLAGGIARRLVDELSQRPLTVALLRKIAPLVYQYMTDKHMDGDNLERACAAAFKGRFTSTVPHAAVPEAARDRISKSIVLAPPISIPPRRKR